MEELQLFRGDTVLIKGKKRRDTVSQQQFSIFEELILQTQFVYSIKSATVALT